MTNRCPQCFTPTDTVEAAFMCIGTCLPERDDAASAVLGVEVSSKRVFTIPPPAEQRRPRRPTAGVCPECRTRSAAEVCLHCHQPFRPGWRDHETTCVVLAGARTSGKSVFVAVLVHQLKLMARRASATLEATDDETAQVYQRNYEDPLFGTQLLLPSTPAARGNKSLPIPLVFRWNPQHGPSRMIVFRDLPGENLEAGTLDSALFGMCGRADGIVFLVDPFRVRSIRDMLVELIPEPKKIGADAKFVLENFTRLLRQSTRSAQLEVPMAVVISKFDALQRLSEADDAKWRPIMRNVGAAVQRDPSLSKEFDRQDADLLEAEVRSLLHQLGAEELLIQLDTNYRTIKMFAVSALGHAPDGDQLHKRGIAPFRVLDPMKWILARSHAIPGRV